MRKKYHTLEELRKAAAERQARWRERERWKHKQSVLAVYGRAKAQGFFKDGVTPQEVARLEETMRREALLVTNEICHEKIERRTDGVRATAVGDRQADIEGGGTPECEEVVHGGGASSGDVEGRRGATGEGELIVGPIEGWDTPSREYAERNRRFMKFTHRGNAAREKALGDPSMLAAARGKSSLEEGTGNGTIPQLSPSERRASFAALKGRGDLALKAKRGLHIPLVIPEEE